MLADEAVVEAAVRDRRDLCEHLGGIGRELDVEAFCELRQPGQLVRAGRDDRPPQALQAALEVDVGAVPLQVARSRQDEVGPADERRPEHRDRQHGFGPFCHGSNVRVGHGLVAGDDEQPDRLGVLRIDVPRRGPRVCDAAAVRGLRQMERGRARLVRDPEIGRQGRQRLSTRPRPDESNAVARPNALVVGRGQDLGAVPTRGPDPEIHDRRALDHGLVAEDDHDLGGPDRGQGRAERVECRVDLFGQDC